MMNRENKKKPDVTLQENDAYNEPADHILTLAVSILNNPYDSADCDCTDCACENMSSQVVLVN